MVGAVRAHHRLRVPLVASILVVCTASLVAVTPQAGASPPASAYVIGPKAARALGFPTTLRAAKQSKATGVKGCTTAVDAVYLDATKQTGLVSEVVNCTSSTAASGAMATVRKRLTSDRSIPVPNALGTGAFATSVEAPQYLLVWRTGSHLGFTAFDTDVPATTSTSTSSTAVLPPITTTQEALLGRAALAQLAIDRHVGG
jgi:hypothetical protein